MVRCVPVQTNVRWPLPVDQRLNELVSMLSAGGVHVTRSQLLAALVAHAPSEMLDLQDLLMSYSQKSAGAIVLQPRGDVIVRKRRPGRRPAI